MAGFGNVGMGQFGSDAGFAQQYQSGGDTKKGEATWLGMLGAKMMGVNPDGSSKSPDAVPPPQSMQSGVGISPDFGNQMSQRQGNTPITTPIEQSNPQPTSLPPINPIHDDVVNKGFELSSGYTPPPSPTFNQASFSQASSTPAQSQMIAPPAIPSGGGSSPMASMMGGEEGGGDSGGDMMGSIMKIIPMLFA